MLKVALTGGIATGKTHVLARFAALGAPTIDADRLVHEAMQPGSPVALEIGRRFGPSILGEEGAVDRRKLGARVFTDPAARSELEAVLHPLVYTKIEEWFAALGEVQADRSRLGVADIPLLYETGRERMFDRVVVTACDPEEQVRRVIARDGISEGEARQRLAAQLPIGDKVRRADFVIWTDGPIGEMDHQVGEVYGALLRGLGEARR